MAQVGEEADELFIFFFFLRPQNRISRRISVVSVPLPASFGVRTGRRAAGVRCGHDVVEGVGELVCEPL